MVPGRGGVTDSAVHKPGKSSPRSFRRGKLSATRYYSHAVLGIAELYEGYFFLPERRAFFT